ncbi:MAG: hypothetical protein VKJ05_06420 [Synechococcaceae cyanobacterium]|nr:hypothetical protein [Synechococcaceae cyanobacterium]
MPFLNRPCRPHARVAWLVQLRRVSLALPGMALFSGFLLGLPLTPHTMAQMQALNQELGKLCSKPPRQALNVCRIHARLVGAL